MIDMFYELQSRFDQLNIKIISKISYWVLLHILRIYAPFYYDHIAKNDVGICQKSDEEHKIIISLTSFPDRIPSIGVVLETLLHQTVRPNKIILWLAKEQFPFTETVEMALKKYTDRGVEIRYCDDLRSHKKYYYSMLEYPEYNIVTVDDDIFYSEKLVENLLNQHYNYPNCIICGRAHKIILKNNNVDKYNNWDWCSRGTIGPDRLLIPTGGGGTLYPPNCLPPETFNKEDIKSLCFYADDIWLKCMALLNNVNPVKLKADLPEIFTVKGTSENGLAKMNVEQGRNDEQLKQVVKRFNIRFE